VSANPLFSGTVAPEAVPERSHAWDLPTRLFHWSLAASVLAAFVTGKLGGAWMVWHGRIGLAIVGLIVFRLAWGFAGPAAARFRQFAPSPAKVRAYLQGKWRGVGHNPLGALSVFALLGVLLLQVVTGLVGNDEIGFSGPLAHWVDDAWSTRLTGLHHQLSDVLAALIVLHVAAIAFYLLVAKRNLVKPMFIGRAPFNRAALIVCVLIAAAAVYAAGSDRREPPAAVQPVRSPGW